MFEVIWKYGSTFSNVLSKHILVFWTFIQKEIILWYRHYIRSSQFLLFTLISAYSTYSKYMTILGCLSLGLFRSPFYLFVVPSLLRALRPTRCHSNLFTFLVYPSLICVIGLLSITSCSSKHVDYSWIYVILLIVSLRESKLWNCASPITETSLSWQRFNVYYISSSK